MPAIIYLSAFYPETFHGGNLDSLIRIIERFVGKKGDDGRWAKALNFALGIGLMLLTLLGYLGGGGGLGALTALFIGGCAISVGALIGFLFGIPRLVQQPQEGATGNMAGASYVANTNLEEISKWLTGTIVGLTMVQADVIMKWFDNLCMTLTNAFGGPSLINAPLIALVLVYFSVTGGAGSYLWTRLMLTDELRRIEFRARQSPEYLEGLTQALLYQPSPRGFLAALKEGEKYLNDFGEDNWRIYQALACAHGQEYKYLCEHNGTQEEKEASRSKALMAVRRVLELNPGERESMRRLWDKGIATAQENDLVVFFADTDFDVLLNPPAA